MTDSLDDEKFEPLDPYDADAQAEDEVDLSQDLDGDVAPWAEWGARWVNGTLEYELPGDDDEKPESVRMLPIAMKGDVEGHEFHGNQYARISTKDHADVKRTVDLEVVHEDDRFLHGYQVDREGARTGGKGFDQRKHVIDKTAITRRQSLKMNNHYGELEVEKTGDTAPKLTGQCKECGGRMQRNGLKAPWRHQRPTASGDPHDHPAGG